MGSDSVVTGKDDEKVPLSQLTLEFVIYISIALELSRVFSFSPSPVMSLRVRHILS